MSTILQPLRNRVVIAPDTVSEKTQNGIIIPEAAQEKEPRGTVIAVGPGRMTNGGVLIPVAVKAGDIVRYSKYAGTDVIIDGVGYLIMDDEAVLAVEDAV